MSDFISWVIRNGRTSDFSERVVFWRELYVKKIAGKQNEVRIAANHAALAAALELFAEYMGDAWAFSGETVKCFCDTCLVERMIEAAQAVEEELAATIFVNHLKDLISSQQVLLEGGEERIELDRKDQDRLVGKVIRVVSTGSSHPTFKKSPQPIDSGDIIGISIHLALAKVQEFLRRQGKPALTISEQSLIQQLTALGLLLGKDGATLGPDASGEKSFNHRVNGGQVRLVLFRAETLGYADKPTEYAGMGTDGPQVSAAPATVAFGNDRVSGALPHSR
jgi:hypothetical protein